MVWRDSSQLCHFRSLIFAATEVAGSRVNAAQNCQFVSNEEWNFFQSKKQNIFFLIGTCDDATRAAKKFRFVAVPSETNPKNLGGWHRVSLQSVFRDSPFFPATESSKFLNFFELGRKFRINRIRFRIHQSFCSWRRNTSLVWCGKKLSFAESRNETKAVFLCLSGKRNKSPSSVRKSKEFLWPSFTAQN